MRSVKRSPGFRAAWLVRTSSHCSCSAARAGLPLPAALKYAGDGGQGGAGCVAEYFRISDGAPREVKVHAPMCCASEDAMAGRCYRSIVEALSLIRCNTSKSSTCIRQCHIGSHRLHWQGGQLAMYRYIYLYVYHIMAKLPLCPGLRNPRAAAANRAWAFHGVRLTPDDTLHR